VKVWSLGLISKHWNTVYIQFCYMFARNDIYIRLHLLLIIIHITCISLSLRQTSAHIHLTSVLGVLETQETSCIVIAGLFERDTFDLFLPEFDKPWVIHLRETCCCSINLCTWISNTDYKNRIVYRHQLPFQSTRMCDSHLLVCTSSCSISRLPSQMHVIRSVSTYAMLISVIKLTKHCLINQHISSTINIFEP
jgi:hypothetical protein